MNSLEDILIILRSVKPDLFNRYHINYLAVLESSLSDEPVLTAGLGVVVEFNDGSKPQFVELESYLSDLLRRSVHLIVKNGMSEEMYSRMLPELHQL